MTILAVLINMLGNILYSLAYVFQNRNFILVGRLLAGLGSSSLTIGLSFITRTVILPDYNESQQRGEIADYKMFQSFARIVGPIIGFCLTTINDPSPNDSVWSLVFNYFTIPSWIAVANNVFIMLPLAIYRQENAIADLELERLPKENKSHLDHVPTIHYKDPLVRHLTFWTFIQFSASVFYWSIGSNLFAIAFAEYHMIYHKSDSWKLYIGGTVGFIVGFVSYKKYKGAKELTNWFQTGGLLLFALGHLLLIDYGGHFSLSPFKFYAGVCVGTAGTAWFFSASNTYLAWMLNQPAFRVQSEYHIASLTGINTAGGSLGRFIGPTIFSAIADIQTSSLQLGCNSLDPHHYQVEGCILKNSNFVIALFAAFSLVTAISCLVYHRCTRASFSVRQYTYNFLTF